MRSLKGKTFGVPALGSEGRALARALLKHAGPDAERDVSYLAVGLGPQAVASFQAKQADAVVAFTPVTIVLEEKGAHTVFDMAGSKGIEWLTRWTVAVYVTTREKATADADKLRRLQQAWQRHPPSPGTR